MAITYQRARRQGPKKDIHQLQLGKIFIKPSQGIFGIRRAGTPKWSEAGLQVLKPIRAEMAAKGIASHCIGKRGREFFKCLKENAMSNLGYAGKFGFWYALQNKGDMTIEYVAQHRFIDMNKPDTAKMNGRRIVHYVMAGMDIDTAVKNALVIPVELFDEEGIRQSVSPENVDKILSIAHKIQKMWQDNIPIFAEQFAKQLSSYELPQDVKNKLAGITAEAVRTALANVNIRGVKG